MLEHAKIIKIDNGIATLEIINDERCKNCSMCSITTLSTLTVKTNTNRIGDIVVIDISQSKLIPLLSIIIPLILITLAVVLTAKLELIWQVLFVILSFLLSIINLQILNRFAKIPQIKIKGKLENESNKQ